MRHLISYIKRFYREAEGGYPFTVPPCCLGVYPMVKMHMGPLKGYIFAQRDKIYRVHFLLPTCCPEGGKCHVILVFWASGLTCW